MICLTPRNAPRLLDRSPHLSVSLQRGRRMSVFFARATDQYIDLQKPDARFWMKSLFFDRLRRTWIPTRREYGEQRRQKTTLRDTTCAVLSLNLGIIF